MFRRKHRSKWKARIEDGSGRVLFEEELERLPIGESVVLSLSAEFFDDPEPCEIHRSAVIMRALEEIRLACAADQPVPIGGLSDRVRRLLGAYGTADSIRVWEEASS